MDENEYIKTVALQRNNDTKTCWRVAIEDIELFIL